MESEKVKEIKKKLQQINERELSSLGMILQFEIDANDILTLINELEKKKTEQLKQFAERLKEVLEEYRLENEYFIKDEPNGNLWQMNASVFCIEVTQDGGLIDETLKEFVK